MSLLRRLVGGGRDSDRPGDGAHDPGTAAEDELARDRELLLEDARRLDSDLIRRQLRYADRSWTPPAQGGPRRADDEDAEGPD